MIENVRARLLEARDGGEILTIIYNGGSQPGTKRNIVPVKVDATDVRAREADTGAQKVFKIEKIVLVTEGGNGDAVAGKWKDPSLARSIPDPASLAEAITPHMAELEALGWRVELTGEHCRLLYAPKVAKTGRVFKPKIGVELEYRPLTSDGIYVNPADDFFVEDLHPNSRPYNIDGSTFAHLGKATQRFLDRARERAPAKA